MTIQALQELINRQAAAASSLGALAALIDARISGKPLDPALDTACQRVLDAFGAGDALAGLTPVELTGALALIRHGHALDGKLMYERTRAAGWAHEDDETLQHTGTFSAGFVQPLARAVVPSLPGLADRLGAPGGAFLDIGTGVGQLAIAVARTWPEVRVVGVDPWRPSMALARRNVEAAGLAGRIELREHGAEALRDEAAFDLAWIPLPFIPPDLVKQVCERAAAALRPGGWVLLNGMNPKLEPVPAAIMGLRVTMFGNRDLAPATLEELAREAGFVDVRLAPLPPSSPIALVVGRKS